MCNQNKNNTVHIIGAGTGNVELLTVSAYKMIKNAYVIVSDMLVSNDILNLAKNAKIYIANKTNRPHEGQREIFDAMFNELQNGNDVIRLKIGDPTIYSRITEEILEITKRGYEVQVYPALSSLNTIISGGIPLTSRGISNKVIVSTAYGMNNKYPNIQSYTENTTNVFFMAVNRIRYLVESLIQKNYPIDIPILIVENSTLKKQRVFRTRLCDILNIFKINNVISPALIIIGEITECLHNSCDSFYNHKNATTVFQKKL
jgi:siroheme synthase